MQPRMNYAAVAPEVFQAMLALEKKGNSSSIEKRIRELIKLRASQINGCAYCIDIHTKDLEHGGETHQRMHALMAWRETPYFSERERAALEWTEEITLIAENHARDEVYTRVREQFSDVELVELTLSIVTINAWNRLAIAFRPVPGDYKPGLYG